MPFSGDTFTHLFSWDQDPQRQEKIINARLEAEFDGFDTGLSSLAARGTYQEAQIDHVDRVTLTNNVAANATSISLAAGDWDVHFMAHFVCNTSSCNNILAGLNTTSATLPADTTAGFRSVLAVGMTDNTSPTLVGIVRRFELVSTTTVYLVGRAGWTGVDAVQLFGKIRARIVT